MQKTAQDRSWFNKIKEMTNFSGKAAEKFFDPEFKKVMNSLRKTDNNIRSIVAGETIGVEDDPESGKIPGDPGRYKISMKNLLKQIKSNLNRKEYMAVAADLGRFHSKLFEISNQIHGFDDRVNDLHHQFLFGTKDKPVLDEEQWEHLQDLKKRYAANKRKEFLIKQAGIKDIADFFHNITSQRGKALSAYEKRYPKQTATLKKDSAALLEEGQATLSIILSTLKDMANARAVRNPDVYMSHASKIVKRCEVFDAKFKNYYQTNVKNFLEKAESIYPTKEVKDSKELGKQEIAVPELAVPGNSSPNIPDLQIGTKPVSIPTAPGRVPNEFETAPTAFPGPSPVPGPMPVPKQHTLNYDSSVLNPQVSKNTVPYGDGVTPSANSAPGSTDPSQLTPPNEFNKSDQVAAQILSQNPEVAKRLSGPATAHHKFYNSLEKLSNEDPRILSAYISKYARSIQSSDPTTALQLFTIVRNIKR